MEHSYFFIFILCLKIFILCSAFLPGMCYNKTIERGANLRKNAESEIIMEHIVNQESVMVQMTRGTLCDILIALTVAQQAAPEAKKWSIIHDELQEILYIHDERAKQKGWRW